MLNYGWRLRMGGISFIASCVFVFQSNTFFESITVLQGESGQLVYVVSDCHGIVGGANEIVSMWNVNCHDELLDRFGYFAKKKMQRDFLAITEDSIGYKGPNQVVKSYTEYLQNFPLTKECPLADLSAKLERKGFPVLNAEYRFLRAWGLATGIPLSSTGELQFACPVSGHDIVQEYEQVASEIEHYNDNALQQVYRRILQFVNNQGTTVALDQIRNDHENVVQCINEKISSANRLRFCHGLSHFDGPFFDARVAHLIVTHPTVKKIILLLGAMHANPVGEILKNSLRYKEVAHVGVRREYPYEPIAFDPIQEDQNNTKIVLSPLELSQLELVGADDPQRFMEALTPS